MNAGDYHVFEFTTHVLNKYMQVAILVNLDLPSALFSRISGLGMPRKHCCVRCPETTGSSGVWEALS